MKLLNIASLVLAMLFSCGTASAAIVEGRLELQWGDPARGAPGGALFRATLVTDDGARHALDAAQARQAAGDLHALAGRRVAVEFVTSARGSASRVAVIVPADNFNSATPLQNAIVGTTTWVTLMCKFSDMPTEQKPLSFFQSQYGNSPGQLDHYWREVSYNKINLNGSSAHGWYTLPQPRSFYVPVVNGVEDADLNTLFNDCTAAADADVNFAVNGGVQGINMMFNGDLDGYAWGGSRCLTLDGINKCWSSTWNPPWSFNNLAPLAHEMGHGYGLPHANNSDGDSDPYDNPWDVMSDAWNNAANDPTYGSVAKHISTYHRDRLGWIDAARKAVVPAGSNLLNVLMDRASLEGSNQKQMIVVTLPGEPASRFYTIEARQRAGKYDANLAGNAVIIHHVDTTRSTPAWSMDADVPPANRANNEGSMFKAGELWTAPGNAFRVRVLRESIHGY
ncbi:MAG: hypothetical protein ABIO38_03540, partial [Luteimonas sp.]